MQIGEEGQNLKHHQISRSLTIFLTGIFWPGISATQNPESGIGTDREPPGEGETVSKVNPLVFFLFSCTSTKKKKRKIHSHGDTYNNSTKSLPQRPKTLKKENSSPITESVIPGNGVNPLLLFCSLPSTAWPAPDMHHNCQN